MKRERVLRQATQKWLLIVKRHACEMGIIPPEEDELVACFGTCSVYTILKRANNFLAFLRWADVMPENSAKVFVDRVYWNYVEFLKQTGAGASCASSFLASVRFSIYVVGLQGVEVPTRRCIGAAEQMLSASGDMRQAQALTVAQVTALHECSIAELANGRDFVHSCSMSVWREQSDFPM